MQSRAASTYNNTYQTLGNALSAPAVIAKIVNNGSVDLLISTDGTTDNDIIPANSFCLYDLRTNRGDDEDDFMFRQGTQFYVKGAAAGTGTVYLVVIRERT